MYSSKHCYSYILCCLADMASSSAQERSGVITPVPHFIVDFEKVEMKPNNFLPLLNIPMGKEYYLEARNFLVSGCPGDERTSCQIPTIQPLGHSSGGR